MKMDFRAPCWALRGLITGEELLINPAQVLLVEPGVARGCPCLYLHLPTREIVQVEVPEGGAEAAEDLVLVSGAPVGVEQLVAGDDFKVGGTC